MPQKRNPYALAPIRTQAGIASGELAAILVTLHTGSARTDHFHLLNGSIPRLLDESAAIARLAAEVVAGLEVRPEPFAGEGPRASPPRPTWPTSSRRRPGSTTARRTG